MFEVDHAVEETASFQQIGPNRWRAELTGLVTASAEAESPSRCVLHLIRAVDAVLGKALRGVGPFTYDADGVTAKLVAAAGIRPTTE